MKTGIAARPRLDGAEAAALRTFKRLEIQHPLVFRPLVKIDGRSPNYMPGEMLDISLSGCRFRAGFAMSPGQRTKLRINTFGILHADRSIPEEFAADALELVVTAEIVWRERENNSRFVYGIRFVNFHQGDLASLDHAIERLTRA